MLALCALAAACDLGGGVAEARREVAPAVFWVRKGTPPAATSGLLAAPQGPEDGSPARPFGSIGAALAAAPAGALLRLEDAVYEEKLVLSRPVVLLGRGTARTSIVSMDEGAPALDLRSAGAVELHGVSIEGGPIGVLAQGGTLRLQDVALRRFSDAALVARGSQVTLLAVEVVDVARGATGRGIDLTGGTLEARGLLLRQAGRRAVLLHGTRALLVDVDAEGSGLSALQATDGAEVRVTGGRFVHQGGAALYAGGARLTVEHANVSGDDYAIMGFRKAEITVTDSELTDYRVAAIALVHSSGSVLRCHIARGGSEGGISIVQGTAPIRLDDNRIQDPGPMGVHITTAEVTARGNTITGARLDRQRDLGDGFFGMDADLRLDGNVLRANAGSGVTGLRSRFALKSNGFIGNGRAGVLLLDRSFASATGNLFDRNQGAGVELAEQSRVSLGKNRFGDNPRFDIDVGCGPRAGGQATIEGGNTFAGVAARQRICP